MLHGTESFQNTEAEYTKNWENHDKTASASSEIDIPEVLPWSQPSSLLREHFIGSEKDGIKFASTVFLYSDKLETDILRSRLLTRVGSKRHHRQSQEGRARGKKCFVDIVNRNGEIKHQGNRLSTRLQPTQKTVT